MVKAGKLQYRVTIEEPTAVRDEIGGETKTWATFATRWADVQPMAGREQFHARQVYPTASHLVTMRWLDGVTPEMRVNFRGRLLNIEGVVDTRESRIELNLACTEAI